MTDHILSVRDLKKHFVIGHEGTVNRKPITVKAVDGISFSVDKGENVVRIACRKCRSNLF